MFGCGFTLLSDGSLPEGEAREWLVCLYAFTVALAERRSESLPHSRQVTIPGWLVRSVGHFVVGGAVSV